MRDLIFTKILLLFTIFTAVLAISDDASPLLVARQNDPNNPECISYARIANLSAVAGNSSMRAAFLQKSPDGALQNERMFNTATAQSLPLINNTALNDACGNLTQVAEGAIAGNFSQGIVLQLFNVNLKPDTIQDPQVVPFIILIVIIIAVGSVWMQ